MKRSVAPDKPLRKKLKQVTDGLLRQSPSSSDDLFFIEHGRLRPVQGYPKGYRPLIQAIGEKLPFEAPPAVRKHLREQGIQATGVYMAHDSMGTARYAGRGDIFTRLRSHLKNHPRELAYFSFYVAKKRYQRELETLLLRVSGDQLEFNQRKKQSGITPGRVRDFEAGAKFYRRVDPKNGRGQARQKDRSMTTRTPSVMTSRWMS